MDQLLIYIKKRIPRRLLGTLRPTYHYTLNALAALWYRYPSRSMTVIGITGTTGKTTTVYLLAHLLRHAGVMVGYTSTALLSDGRRDWINPHKMTMLGRFQTQKLLAAMRANGCTVAIVETTSEGIVQFRHRFINYDVLLFTGLYPEHIESHGSFAAYKNAKLTLFTHLARCRHKRGITVPKTIVVNGDDAHATDFLAPWAEAKMMYVMEREGEKKEKNSDTVTGGMSLSMTHPYTMLRTATDGTWMQWAATTVQTRLLGDFTVTNIAAAATAARAVGLTDVQIVAGIATLPDVPGRMERITAVGGYTVIVDYAFEPVAMERLYATVTRMPHTRIIHVLGGTGGGRDRARRPILGRLAGTQADSVIVTNEDPYDEDPQAIIDDVWAGVLAAGKVDGVDAWRVADRTDAIRTAIHWANPGDLVLITGKGCEQSICVADGKKIPHDDRAVVREAIAVKR